MKIMFFENLYETTQTIRFQKQLELELPHIKFIIAGTVKYFENRLKKIQFDAFILDIMTIEMNIRKYDTKELVNRKDVGIELLRRIRASIYKNQNADALIIMRSARAIEATVRSICKREGANHIFRPGGDDLKIISNLKKAFPKDEPQLELPFK